MHEAGGSATIAGVDFEMWFTAYKFVDAFFDEKLKIKPQAKTRPDLQKSEMNKVSMDDVYVYSDSKKEFYNIKSNAPNNTNWTFNQLKKQKVLKQFKVEYKQTPDAVLYFVSQSPCPIFSVLLNRVAGCDSIQDANHRIPGKFRKEWGQLKDELAFSDSDILQFSKQVKYKHIIDTEELKNDITKILEGHITRSKSAPNCLYQLAVDAGKNGKTITKKNIIDHFEKNNIHLKPHMKAEELIEKLKIASESLSLYSDPMINNTPIERKEVEDLFLWIKKPLELEESPIIAVTGKAGCGKTFILKELLRKLQEEKVPVLGIKTDLIIKESLTSISEELGLEDGVKESMAAVVEQYDVGVVILDQIDALSSSASKDRKYINTYFNLISHLKNIDGLRIVISCRSFDLQFDPGLRSFEDKLKEINVADLTEQQVDNVLLCKNINKQHLPSILYDLLKVPLHLKVFCDIYRPGSTQLRSIKTIQDLYGKLWEEKINTTKEPDVINALDIIIKKMDGDKEIKVPSALLDRNRKGADYLKSQSIIYEQGKNQIQFFHSSFFDYCYARFFVACEESLINNILGQEQGLFVRSQVKQVLTYLRESDEPRYRKEMEAFLENKNVRFHLKLIVINHLAFLEDPTDFELQLFRNIIENDSDLVIHFIDGIKYQKWLDTLITMKYLEKFLQSGDNKLIAAVMNMLSRVLKSCPNSVLNFLLGTCDLNDENIANIIIYLDKWEDDKSIRLFMRCKRLLEQSPFYDIMLGKIFPYQPEFLMELFFEDFEQKSESYLRKQADINNEKQRKSTAYTFADTIRNKKILRPEKLNENELELFDKIIEWNPLEVLPKSLEALKKIIEKTKSNEEGSRFYKDMGYDFYGDSLYDYDESSFISKTIRALKKVAANSKIELMNILNGYLSTGSITMIRLVAECFNAKPEWYVEEGFGLLIKDGLLENINSLQRWEGMENLLKNLYPLFSELQKEKINESILSVSPKREKKKIKGFAGDSGYTKFKLLGNLPLEELSKYPELNRQYQELIRKFGESDISAVTNSGPVLVGPPIPGQAYKMMTWEQWIASFKEYDDTAPFPFSNRDFSKGGIIQHSLAFGEAVKKRPGDFYDFIVSIGSREDISIKYFAAGTRGLYEAEYAAEKIKELIKLYWKKEERELRESFIWAMEYIDKKDHLDMGLIEVLKEYALNDPDPENEILESKSYGGDPITSASNSIRGASAWVLGKHALKTPYPDEIFEIFEKIADDESVAVRSLLIQFLPGMIKWNRNKVLSIFMKLTADMIPQVIDKGIDSIHYLRSKNNFHHFIPRIKKVLPTSGERLGQVLMAACTENIPGSKKLLEEGFKINEEIKVGAIDFASRHLNSNDKSTAAKSMEILPRFLNDKSDKVKREYALCFKYEYFKVEDFEKIYDFILQYSKSSAVEENISYFYKFIERCVRTEPEKCIDLIENHSRFEKPDLSLNSVQSELIQIVIEAYNRTNVDDYKEKALDIFDALLKDTSYKSYSLKVLEEYDRG